MQKVAYKLCTDYSVGNVKLTILDGAVSVQKADVIARQQMPGVRLIERVKDVGSETRIYAIGGC